MGSMVGLEFLRPLINTVDPLASASNYYLEASLGDEWTAAVDTQSG